MKSTVIIVALFLLGYLNVEAQGNEDLTILDDETLLIEDFQEDEVGKLPYRWYDRDTNYRLQEYNETVKDTYKYQVLEENGNKFLRYEGSKAMHINLPLRNRENLNIHETPVLKWDWRVHSIPEDGNEDSKSLNDVAASVYVVFDFGRVLFKRAPMSIRYTWSSTLPVGTELSKFFGNQKIVVVASGKEEMGNWVSFERNIVDDYRRLYGEDPPEKPLAFLILSDGDDTGEYIKADYDNIILKNSSDTEY
jgi:hypothetical protein